MSLGNFSACLQAFLTPVIALVATYIAWQQWETNKQKLNLDRYERRLKVYQEVKQILWRVLSSRYASASELMAFNTAVSEADFLFDSDISNYVNEIYRRGLNLLSWSDQYKDYSEVIPEGYDHKKVVTEMHKELEWFAAQHQAAKVLFGRYLKFVR
jgi:uncharacterized protein YktA (UPF0223 family)